MATKSSRGTNPIAQAAKPVDTRSVLDAINAQIAVIDVAGAIIEVNEQWTHSANLRGATRGTSGVGANYLQVCERSFASGDATSARTLQGIREVLSDQAPSFLCDYLCGLGIDDWYEMTVLPLRGPTRGAVISHINISRRRTAELESRRLLTELSQIQRVTLLGELAMSLAHELRQPLSAISMNAETGVFLMQTPVENSEELRGILQEITANGERATEIVRAMGDFLTTGNRESKSFDLNQVIENVCVLMQPSALLANVTVRLALARHLPPVIGDRVQIQLVLLNLMRNAAEAMRGMRLNLREICVQTEMEESGQVHVYVKDTGPGVAKEDAERIFDGFVTTKPDGMGMGLHICRTIARSHNGHLRVMPTASIGATFCLTLPAACPRLETQVRTRTQRPEVD
jgi:signal transduction histidine kinase